MRGVVLGLTIIWLAVSLGCSRPAEPRAEVFTEKDFVAMQAMVEEGMSKSDVLEALGQPDRVSGSVAAEAFSFGYIQADGASSGREELLITIGLNGVERLKVARLPNPPAMVAEQEPKPLNDLPAKAVEIKIGDSKAQVLRLLGEPDDIDDGWRYGYDIGGTVDLYLSVSLFDDVVGDVRYSLTYDAYLETFGKN